MTDTDNTQTKVVPFQPPVPADTAPSEWFGSNSLQIDGQIKFDDWSAIGAWIQTTAAGSPWWLGDWAKYGEELYGDDFYAAVDSEMFDRSHFARCAMTADQFLPEMRHPRVSWEHHSIVAAKVRGSDADRAGWLKRVAEEMTSPAELASQIREAQSIPAGTVDDDELGEPQGDTEKVHPKDPPNHANVRFSFRIDSKDERIADSMMDSLAAMVRVALSEAGCEVSKIETAVSH